MATLAWFGGVALFFITLIFPIQFDRQWITIGWALEGAALLWLFHRIPHNGLKFTGIALLIASFVAAPFQSLGGTETRGSGDLPVADLLGPNVAAYVAVQFINVLASGVAAALWASAMLSLLRNAPVDR